MTPIPDEVLRRLLSACAPDGPLAPILGLYNFTEITYLGEHVCDLADIARELLALREAARRVGWTAYGVGMRAGGAGKTRLLDLGEQLQALFALLPPLPSPTDGALLPEEPK